MKANLSKLEQAALQRLQENSARAKQINNKTILFELLTETKVKRDEAPIKAATLYYTKTKGEPTEEEYLAKARSIKNSLDTMISNYNSPEKIDADKLLVGTKLESDIEGLRITK